MRMTIGKRLCALTLTGLSMLSAASYAAAAVAVLTGRGHEGKTYELAGDESWTLADLAAEIARQTGRAIAYRNLPEAEYASTLAGFGLPAPLARSIAGSATFTPPATFTKTSSAARRSSARFSSTAMIIATRSPLTPLT